MAKINQEQETVGQHILFP